MIKKVINGLLVIFTILSLTIPSFAQNQEKNENNIMQNNPPGIQWIKHFGGPDNTDDAQEVKQTLDGGYILVGTTQSYTEDGRQDAWLIKTDKDGNEEWNRTYGEVGFLNWSFGYSVQQTQDGGYVFVGHRNIYPEDTHAWVVKTTADGTEQWNKMFNTSFRGFSIQQTTDGGYIITGDSPVMDAWLCRIDENGDMLWEQIFYESDSSIGFSVQQTLDGGFIVAGRLYYQQNDNESGFLIKTDADGNEQWNTTYSEVAPFSGFLSVTVLPDGYAVAGLITQPGSNGKAWLVRADESGAMVWNKSYSIGSDISFSSREVACTSDGGFILTGCASAPVPFGWLLKTDAEGNQEWELSLTETYPQQLYSVQETVDGSFIVVGESAEEGHSNALLLKIGHVPYTTITKPLDAFYLFDNERRDCRFPFIIGPITIEADANDTQYSIKYVEFIIDDVLQFVDYSAPYMWKWTKPALFFHTIQVIAVNEVDNCSSSTLDVLKIF
jgi:hypothetical protein